MYCYEVVRENVVNGARADRTEAYYSNRPLEVGGLYMHLRDMKGAYRVLDELEVIIHWSRSRRVRENTSA